MSVQITRKTKLGFGYTSACEQTSHGLDVSNVDYPEYTGTIKQLTKMIESDSTLRLWRSGGTYYNTAWFVKVDNNWRKIHWQYPTIFDLAEKMDNNKYWVDAVDVELED